MRWRDDLRKEEGMSAKLVSQGTSSDLLQRRCCKRKSYVDRHQVHTNS